MRPSRFTTKCRYFWGDNYVLFALCGLIVAALFAWQGNKGFNIADEGFLWYGAQRVLLGEVPVRDFMAYDPGRYYWAGALMSIGGDSGIMSLRAAVAVFQALGLFVGLWLIAESAKGYSRNNLILGFFSALTLMAWMYPRHKLFDVSSSIFLVGILTFLVRSPIPKRYFVAGLGVGLVAVFGRNHGIYGVVGSIGVMLWLNIKRGAASGFLRGALYWGLGIVAGYSPILFMALVVPGFAAAFWDSVRLLFEQMFEHKGTNLPLPVPWPWTIKFTGVRFGEVVHQLLVGLFFVGTLVFAVAGVLWSILRKMQERPVPASFVSAAFLALPYAHFAFSRADVGHLAQGIFPLLIGCLALLATAEARASWPLAMMLCAASLLVMLPLHPGWECRGRDRCLDVEISGSNLRIDRGTANQIALLRELADRYAPNGQSFIAVPFQVSAYPLLRRRSPMWEIYPLFPRPEAFEKKEIERIKAAQPAFAIVEEVPLDDREELRFKNTHPLTYRYIVENFDAVPHSSSSVYQVYKGRTPAP